MKTFQNKFAHAGSILVCALASSCWPAMAGPMDFKDWTASFSSGVQTFSNTSSAGTITGTSTCPGCWGAPTGTYGVATAITPQQFTTEFNANGQYVGNGVDFTFSANYGWGTGGQLLIGNIHNLYEYTLSAWDFNGVQIDVNNWTTPSGLLTEYLHGAPGQLGYFSTSTTSRSVSGLSSLFYVNDSGADANSGQGGVLPLGGLVDVGRIQLTLSSSSLGPNAQSGDFILFNVGTPVPEPSSAVLMGLGGAVVLFLQRRRMAMIRNN